MDTFPGSTTYAIESGGAAPFYDLCLKPSDATETQKFPETFSELLDIKGRPQKNAKHQLKRHKRAKRAKCAGSVIVALCGMFLVAAGAVALWKGGDVLAVLGCGLLLSGAGKVLIAGASFTVCIIEIRRKGGLQTEWKAFFKQIVITMFRELPEKCSQMKGTLRKAAVDYNYQQKNVEIFNLTGSAIEFIGGIVAAVAAGQTGGMVLPIVSAAMIVSGAGTVIHVAASFAHLQPKATVADGIVQICNFTEMERIHELTRQSARIGINVLRLHKNYKDAKRTQQAGNVSEFCGGILVVASGVVEICTGGQMAVLFGAGLIVFGVALPLTAGASFAAWIFGQCKKSTLLANWKEWKEWFCRMERAKLRDLQEKSKKMADKLVEATQKIDSWKQTFQKVKTGGEEITLAGGIVAAVGAIGTVVTGGALPLAAAVVGAVTCGAGKVISSGASVAQNTIEKTFFECLQEEWDELIPLLSREFEVLRSKEKELTSELETNLTDFFQTLASTVFNINALATGKNIEPLKGKPAELLKPVISNPVSQISIDFRRLVKSLTEGSYERKSEASQMLRKLARDLENNAAGMIRVYEELC